MDRLYCERDKLSLFLTEDGRRKTEENTYSKYFSVLGLRSSVPFLDLLNYSVFSINHIVSFLFGVFLMFSCTEKIDFELIDTEHSRLVVDGGITTQPKAHKIKLTKTIRYYAHETTPTVSGAIVNISDGTTVFPLHETASPGVYETLPNVAGEVGQTYTLNILAEGKEYSGSCFLPPVAQIDSIKTEYQSIGFGHFSGYFYIFNLFAQEPEGKGDNYMFNFYFQNSQGDYILDNDTLNETPFQDDVIFDGAYIPGLNIYNMFNWEVNKYAEDGVDSTGAIRYMDSVKVRVEMVSMTWEHINFNYNLMLETDWRGSPFDGPPANIPSNVSNGAFGFFSASDVSTYEFMLYRER